MPSVVFVVQRPDGDVVMERRSEHDTYFPGEWIFPGGKIEPDEIIYSAMKREVEEELGIVPIVGIPLRLHPPIFYKNILRPDFRVYPFVIQQWTGEVPDHILDTMRPVEWKPLSYAVNHVVHTTVQIATLVCELNLRQEREGRPLSIRRTPPKEPCQKT